MAVQTQKDWRPGIRVTAPTPKAVTSVTEVTVMETPACARAALIRPCLERPDWGEGWS